MPEFILDEDGDVAGREFDDLDEFTQGFIECGFFQSECMGVDTETFLTAEFQQDIEDGSADGTIPGDVGFGDLQPKSLAAMEAFCRQFQTDAAALLALAYERDYDARQAGRDLWFTHSGAGVGFWDRDQLTKDIWRDHGSPRVGDPGWDAYAAAKGDSLGEKLSEAAGRGELYLEFSPDGKGGGTVYFEGY